MQDAVQLSRQPPIAENNHIQDFDRTVLPHLDAAYNLARRLARNEQDAQDIVQEAYLRAFRYFANFRGSDGRAWVLTIVRNTCFTWLAANRQRLYTEQFDENLFPPDTRSPNPEAQLLRNDSTRFLRKAIEKLPPDFREVLVLREIEEMSYKEIADSTGLPTGTVMSRLSRARSRLYDVLANCEVRPQVAVSNTSDSACECV